MDLVFGIVRLGREGQGEPLRGHVPLLQFFVFHPFLEILLPVFAVGQSRARQQQAQRQEGGEKSAARGSDRSIHVHSDDPLYPYLPFCHLSLVIGHSSFGACHWPLASITDDQGRMTTDK